MLIGLPGSGKSFKAKELQTAFKESGEEWEILDDPNDKPICFDANIIVADPHLCDPYIRVSAMTFFMQHGYDSLKCLFFENNIEKCLNNICHRADGRVISKAGMESFKYEIPTGTETIEIWQPNETK